MLTNSALIKSFANNNNNTDFSSKKSFSPATVGSPLSRTTTINDSLCSNNTSVTDLNSTNSTGNNMDNQKLDTFSRLSTEFSSITIDSNNSSSLSRPFTSTTGPTSTRDMGTANSKLYSAEFFDDKYKWQNDTSWFMDNWVEFLEHDLNLNSDFRTSRAGGASTDNNIDNNDIGSDFSQPPKPKTHHSLHKASSTSSLSRNFGKSLKLSLSNTSLNSNVSNTGNTNGNKGTRVDRTHRNTNKTTKLKNFFSRIKVKTEDISDSKFLQDNKDLMIQDLRHQNWKLVNLIVSEGRVYIFIFDRMLKNETGLNSLSFAKKFCSTYEVYNLFGTESKLVEDNMVISNDSLDIDDDKKKWVFTITFPSYDSNSTAKTTFHLRTKNKVLAEKYIQSCNFWSSRITPIPNAQFDMVSNLEYGWSEDILTFGHTNTMGGDNNISLGDADNKSTIVSLWKPLYSIDCLVHTDLQTTQLCDTTLKSQYKNLKIFTQSLSDLIDEHLNIVKPKMLAYWQHYVHISNDILSFDLAMDNWTEKYLFLIKHYDHQILYLNALENLRKEAEKLGDAELQNYFAINGEETQSN
ncbi:Arf family guanine nucleotide exchange factor YEL1 SCDLUD_000188 [Saccharomycodes ludwigii]|uniref:Arf family guanine nucleotide exchange factor YEL1 n=1 Tax=Saccharomycodes ludwigii TaxID=36035 RepID=UPI001E8BF2A9|nr:hypothetical protein SCDLUD_000188 [Saccharomycodes ludwigii]KAH3902608.1 hypothetical protein SCDLUD_000188 [Saccharomycodes ludwigii]